jgi:hypothetical protein
MTAVWLVAARQRFFGGEPYSLRPGPRIALDAATRATAIRQGQGVDSLIRSRSHSHIDAN